MIFVVSQLALYYLKFLNIVLFRDMVNFLQLVITSSDVRSQSVVLMPFTQLDALLISLLTMLVQVIRVQLIHLKHLISIFTMD